MPTIKLTQLAADRLRPPPVVSTTFWDSQLPGFGVRISSKNRRTWIAMYRVNGRAVMETLGTMAVIPKVDAARDLARASMVKARSGVHPVEHKRSQAAAAKAEADAQQQTFAWLIEHTETSKNGTTVAKGFLGQYAKQRQRPGTLNDTRRILKRVMPYLGTKLVKHIKRSDIIEILDEVAAKRLRKYRDLTDGPNRMAGAIQTLLNTLFRWAFREGHIDVNPMLRIENDRHGKSTSRDRVLTDDEIRAFWKACDQLGWPFGHIGKLLLLTGQRAGQVSGLKWSELSMPERIWTLPTSRTKNNMVHIVPLTDPVIEIIEQLPRIEGDLVFSLNGRHAVTSFGLAKEKLDTMMKAELGTLHHWTWHDLRRTSKTLMSRAGVRPDISERVLGHAMPGLQPVYDRHEWHLEKRHALQQLAAMVGRIVNPQANIVPLRA